MATVEEQLQYERDCRRKAESTNSELIVSLRQIHGVVKNSLVVLDWTIKLGSIVAVWFVPLPKDRAVQAVAIAALLVLTTIVSKGLRHMKLIEEKI